MSEGRFNGLTKSQWKLLKPLMPKDDPNKKGKPHTSWKRICNSILWILITGAIPITLQELEFRLRQSLGLERS